MTKIQVNAQGKAYMANNKVLLAKELGTKSITQNGTYAASSDDLDGFSSVTVNVSGGSTKYGVSIDYFIGNVTNGVLAAPSTINGITFTGFTTIGNNALYGCFLCDNLFKPIPIISGQIDLSSVTTVNDHGLRVTFFGNQITSVDLSALTTVGDYGLELAFSDNQLTSVDLSSLTTVNYYGLRAAFYDNQITSVDLSALTTVGDYGLSEAFSDNQITSVDLSALTTVGYCGLSDTFAYQLDTNRQCTLQSVSFPALTSNSFESGDDTAFDAMLKGDENVTVHFPSNLQAVIGSWQSVISGFGGTNTTVLFDL